MRIFRSFVRIRPCFRGIRILQAPHRREYDAMLREKLYARLLLEPREQRIHVESRPEIFRAITRVPLNPI